MRQEEMHKNILVVYMRTEVRVDTFRSTGKGGGLLGKCSKVK
jgi:protein subunit release factor A